MSKLTLRYKFDASFFDASLTRDDFGYLSIDVETDRISAKGGFWVQWQDVKEFGEALGRYPIGDDLPPGGPSVITRVLRLNNPARSPAQARRA